MKASHPAEGKKGLEVGCVTGTNLALFAVAGCEHFKNHRGFLRRQGLPGLIAGNGLTVEKEKILGGGTMMISVTSAL